jgi:histidinol-phosphate aminotransferase
MMNARSEIPMSLKADQLCVAEAVIRPEIAQMHAYPVQDATGYIKLDTMENPYRLSVPLREAFGRRLAELEINRYPVPNYVRLKALIQQKLGVPDGFDVVLGNGSDELITMLTNIIAKPGACIVAPAPSFVMYSLAAKIAGVRFVPVDLNPDFTLDLPAMLQVLARERPALTHLCFPNNPTGTAFSHSDVETILRAAPGLVVIDEAYQPFALDTWMPRLAEFPNLVVMRTVSKIGLAGIRLGYASGAKPWTDALEKVRPPYNLGVLPEAAALFALEHYEVLADQAKRLREEREVLSKGLALIPGVAQFPSRANFILVRVPDSGRAIQGLLARKIMVKDVGKQHPLLVNCLRISVSTPEENALLLSALAASI